MSWFKIYNLWRQPAPKNSATTDKYLPYNSPDGGYDCFPLEWDKAIQESPSASSCLSTIQDFMEGFGFSDTELEKLIVNSKGETFWQIHHQTVGSTAEFYGAYWLLRFNALAGTTEWEVLPFENCRLGIPDDKGYISKVYYNSFFGTKEYSTNKNKTVIYDIYNPNAIKQQIAEQKEKFKGQVLVVGEPTVRSRYYTFPEPYSVIDWMKIEAGIADYHQGKIDEGFLQQYMLVFKGNPNDPSTNPDYQDTNNGQPATVAQVMDDYIANNFMGRGNHSTLMVQWVATNDEVPSVVTIPTSANSDLFVTLDNQAIKKITVGWNVPAILANIHEGVSLGGDGNMVRVAVKLMQQRVIKKQRQLTDAYSKVLKNWVKPYTQPISIVPYNPYPELEKIDPLIWAALSREEQREWINSHTEIELIEPAETEVISPDQPQAKLINAVPIAFPEKVRENARKALEYQDKMGLKCSSGGGRQVAEAIIENKSMPMRQIKRIYNYLKKRPQFANSLYNEGCEVIEYHAWGGKEMFDFLEGELKRLDAWLN